MWLEDVLENSRVAVGCKSFNPHYNLSRSLIHYTSYIPVSALLLLLPRSQQALSSLLSFSVLFLSCWLPKKKKKKKVLWIFPVTNDLLFTSPQFTSWCVCCVWKLLGAAVKFKGGFILLFKTARQMDASSAGTDLWFSLGFHLSLIAQTLCVTPYQCRVMFCTSVLKSNFLNMLFLTMFIVIFL